jgi:formylglycine-generating enzyme required for sulfatase activity
MKRKLAMITLTLWLGLPFVSGPAVAARKTTIAVVDFGISEVSEETSRKLTQKIREVLSKSQLVNVSSRDEIEKSLEKADMLYKMKLEQVECQNVSCAIKVGAALKAGKVIIGKIIKDEKHKNYVIWAKLINVAKGDVEFVASVEGALDADLTQLAIQLGEKVANWLPKPGETEEQVRKRRIEQQRREEEAKERQREKRLKELAYRKPGTCPKGMILIPAGEFIMGSDPADADRLDNEAANKKVMVKEFCIDKYEYPNRAGATPFRKAEWFAGKDECQNQGKRLCTEAEWEKACKGTNGFKYPYGNQFDPQKCNVARQEGDKLIKGRVDRAGTHKDCVTGYGVYDMSGNVWEWTADYYDPDARTFVLRGGSYGSSPRAARCSMRREGMPFIRRKDIGFRCCK